MIETLPPYAATLGIITEPGSPTLVLPSGPHLMGRPNFLHGGAIAGLLELAAYRAVRLVAPAAARLKPITITVDYLRGGRLVETYARGHVSRLGGRIANVEAVAWQEDEGAPIGAARLNFLIVTEPPAG